VGCNDDAVAARVARDTDCLAAAIAWERVSTFLEPELLFLNGYLGVGMI
jgi:hypothetical protein